MANDLQVKRYVELDAHKRELEAELAGVNKEMSELEPHVLTYFEETGTDLVRFRDLGLTVYLRRTVRAQVQVEDRDTVSKVLKQLGYGDMVKEAFNLNSLSSLIREFDKAGEDMPGPLKPYVAAIQMFTAEVRKS